MAFHMYNEELYNVAQYNADTTAFWQQLSDSMTLSDVLLKAPTLVKTESLSMSDSRSVLFMRNLLDNLLCAEVFTKQVTNKILSDTIRTESWFGNKRNPGNSPWGD